MFIQGRDGLLVSDLSKQAVSFGQGFFLEVVQALSKVVQRFLRHAEEKQS
jgi:hypothetical protein